MRRISPIKSGTAVGAVVSLWHLMWVTLVGLGWAKPVLDFVLGLHFIDLQYSLQPYAATTAAALLLITFTIGAIFGATFALVWNWLGSGSPSAWATNRVPGVAAERT